jgi:hypothetical protein
MSTLNLDTHSTIKRGFATLIVESRPKSLIAGEDPAEVIEMLAAPTEARGVRLGWQSVTSDA